MDEDFQADCLLAALADLALLKGIPRDDLAALAARSRYHIFQAGDVLVRQGIVSDWMYVLRCGRVRVERTHPQFVKPVMLVELVVGQTVGEVGLLEGQPQPVTVTALEDTEAWALSAAALALILRQLPEVADALLQAQIWHSASSFAALHESVAQREGAALGAGNGRRTG